MARKGIIERVTETFLPGDKEPGEQAPADDSHIGSEAAPLADDDTNDDENENEPQTYRVEIAGTEREVDQATYDMVMADRAANKVVADPEQEAAPESEFDVADFYGDPEAYLRATKDAAVKEARASIRQEDAATSAQQDFWNSFYDENPDFKGDEMLVKMTLAKNMKDLRSLSDGKGGRDALANLVSKEVLRITNKQKKGQKQPDDTTQLEGGSVSVPTAESSDAEATSDATPAHRPPSIGDAIKQRKLNRDRARRGETQLS
jgi:hypothetical protein